LAVLSGSAQTFRQKLKAAAFCTAYVQRSVDD